jgi:microcystin-dependent protein
VLYNLIGTKFGGGTGTFMLPNLVGRTIFGYDPSQVEFNVIGKKGGTFVVPVPAHVHAMPHTHPMPHTHEHPHTHTINHDHGNTGAAGAHSHLFNAINNATAFANTNIPRGGGGTATTFPTDIEANHVHDVPPFAGPSGGVSDGTSGQPSVASTSGASVPNTSSTGAAGAEMIPPYVTLSYIIRIA